MPPLYLWAIMLGTPAGAFTKRREDTDFKRERSSKVATEWLEWEAERKQTHIHHQMNDSEKRIGERRLPMDGFHGPSQFFISKVAGSMAMTAIWRKKKTHEELLQETQAIYKYIKDQGYRVVEMWECQWRRIKKTSSQVQQFLNTTSRRPLDDHNTLIEEQILNAIRS